MAVEVSPIEPARLEVLAVTCSIEAAVSLIDETICSVEVVTEAACVAVSLSEAAISLLLLTALSSEVSCSPAPVVIWSAMRLISPARPVMSLACCRMRATSSPELCVFLLVCLVAIIFTNYLKYVHHRENLETFFEIDSNFQLRFLPLFLPLPSDSRAKLSGFQALRSLPDICRSCLPDFPKAGLSRPPECV